MDPDGRTPGVSMNLVPPGNPNGTEREQNDYKLNLGFNSVNTSWGQMTIAIHGNKYGVYINHVQISVDDFAEMIRNNPRYAEAKQEA